jgi:hypothetical protein
VASIRSPPTVEAILFLAGDRAGWITGATLPIDGGVLDDDNEGTVSCRRRGGDTQNGSVDRAAPQAPRDRQDCAGGRRWRPHSFSTFLPVGESGGQYVAPAREHALWHRIITKRLRLVPLRVEDAEKVAGILWDLPKSARASSA